MCINYLNAAMILSDLGVFFALFDEKIVRSYWIGIILICLVDIQSVLVVQDVHGVSNDF